MNINTLGIIRCLRRGNYFIDKQMLSVIVTRYLKLSGRNSVVECHLAKVDVDGSNPFARSIFLWRHSQVAKAAVCKTVIPRFKSGCRLQKANGAASYGCPFFCAGFGDHVVGFERFGEKAGKAGHPVSIRHLIIGIFDIFNPGTDFAGKTDIMG